MRAVLRIVMSGAAGLCLITGCGKSAPPNAEVQNSHKEMLERVEQRKAEKTVAVNAQNAVQEFQTRYGRLPTNLFEVVQYGIVDELPKLPDGLGYSYNAQLGNVSLRKVEASEAESGPAPLPFEN